MHAIEQSQEVAIAGVRVYVCASLTSSCCSHVHYTFVMVHCCPTMWLSESATFIPTVAANYITLKCRLVRQRCWGVHSLRSDLADCVLLSEWCNFILPGSSRHCYGNHSHHLRTLLTQQQCSQSQTKTPHTSQLSVAAHDHVTCI